MESWGPKGLPFPAPKRSKPGWNEETLAMKRSTSKRSGRRGERGQALAEFALILPLFLVIVFGIVDFGMAFHSYITITNAAREGARLGVVQASSQQISDKVYATSDLSDESTNMTVTVTNAQGAPGGSVVVKVDYEYDLITPVGGLLGFFGGSLGPSIAMSSTADMRLE